VLLMALGGNGVKSRRTNERFVASSFSMMPKRQVQSGEVVEIDDRMAGENVQRISRLARRFESRRRSWRRVGRQRRRRTTTPREAVVDSPHRARGASLAGRRAAISWRAVPHAGGSACRRSSPRSREAIASELAQCIASWLRHWFKNQWRLGPRARNVTL
jgi:hypothetical protein